MRMNRAVSLARSTRDKHRTYTEHLPSLEAQPAGDAAGVKAGHLRAEAEGVSVIV
jgi:hypothetical protein